MFLTERGANGPRATLAISHHLSLMKSARFANCSSFAMVLDVLGARSVRALSSIHRETRRIFGHDKQHRILAINASQKQHSAYLAAKPR
jgi:hypothetical protein